MSERKENELLKVIIETQASRIKDQEETIKELRNMVDELRSLKVNLEETLEEFRRQFFGVKSEKTSVVTTDVSDLNSDKEKTESVKVKSHTRACLIIKYCIKAVGKITGYQQIQRQISPFFA